ncbi:MAG: hypothetical protein KC502_15080 [Myxococcales bacterium]|nr:hypothetical protein [Myxococcales bacterium]
MAEPTPPQNPRRRGVPLRLLLTASMVGLIAVAAVAITWTTWASGRASIDELWHALGDSFGARTAHEVQRFLEPARPFATLTADAVRVGMLDVHDDKAVLAWMELALDANPQFTWASFGRADGTYLACYRWPSKAGIRMRRTTRTLLDPALRTGAPPKSGPMPMTALVDAERQPDGSWRPLPSTSRRYDPRMRPWYKKGIAVGAVGGWSPPYIFLSRMQAGVAYVRTVPKRGGTGTAGVIAVEFEASPLSDYVRGLPLGKRGRAVLVAQSGEVVAHPKAALVEKKGDKYRLFSANQHPDLMLRTAWAALEQRAGDEKWQAFETGPLLVMARPLDGVPWIAISVVPKDDFYGQLRNQTKRSLLIALLIALVAATVALRVSRGLTGAVARVSEQMRKMALFELGEAPDAEGNTTTSQRSAVRELAEMDAAAGSLRHGLRSFSRYVPHQLVRHLLRSGQEARIGGEKKELTVLFSDIAGFTPIVERTAPEVVLDALGDYLHRMNQAIATTDGTVCQYLGDAVMAFWGAPMPQADHAVRACHGALAMAAQCDALLAEAEGSDTPKLPTRFGLNTGEVMVGNIGAPERFNYAILGDPVNTAARIEGLNKVYGTTILIGAHTAQLAKDAVVLRRVDRVQVKGRSDPLDIFELIGAKGEVAANILAGISAYEAAFELYLAGEFGAAQARFSDLDWPRKDHAAAVLADRCAKLQDASPGADWDGTLHMQTK